MKRYCFECKNEQDAKIVRKNEVFPVKGDPIEVISDVVTCTVCGEEIFDEELDGKTLERVYKEYRDKHNLLSLMEIKAIKSKYGSSRTVDKILGWSKGTMARYENGSIPDIAHHEQLLRLKNDSVIALREFLDSMSVEAQAKGITKEEMLNELEQVREEMWKEWK